MAYGAWVLGAVLLVGGVVGVGGGAGTAYATEDPRAAAAVAAAELRDDPVYVAGAVSPVDEARIRSAVRRLADGGVPAYAAVGTPVGGGDAYVNGLYERLRADAVYVAVDAEGFATVHAYDVETAGYAGDVQRRLFPMGYDDTASPADVTVAALDGMRTGHVPPSRVVFEDDMGVHAPTFSDYVNRALPSLAAIGAAVAAVLFGVRLVRGPKARRGRAARR